jgi:hypothetical protein
LSIKINNLQKELKEISNDYERLVDLLNGKTIRYDKNDQIFIFLKHIFESSTKKEIKARLMIEITALERRLTEKINTTEYCMKLLDYFKIRESLDITLDMNVFLE